MFHRPVNMACKILGTKKQTNNLQCRPFGGMGPCPFVPFRIKISITKLSESELPSVPFSHSADTKSCNTGKAILAKKKKNRFKSFSHSPFRVLRFNYYISNQRMHTILLKSQYYNTSAPACFGPHWYVIRENTAV